MTDTTAHTSVALPLPLAVPHTQQPAHTLPLAFTRLLGTVDNAVVVAPVKQVVAADWTFAALPTHDVSGCLNHNVGSDLLINPHQALNHATVDVAQCHVAAASTLKSLWRDTGGASGKTALLAGCQASSVSRTQAQRACQHHGVGTASSVRGCGGAAITPVQYIHTCTSQSNTTAFGLSALLKLHGNGAAMAWCQSHKTTPVRMPPGDFYPVPLPEPEPPKDTRACGPQPPATALPLRFARRRINHHPAMLPLPFACVSKNSTPILKGYIMINNIRASVDRQPLEILSAKPRTDISGFCWQVSITLYPDDFIKLRMDERQPGNEAVITLHVNNEDFVFLAEDYSDNREFGKRSYTVTGRSTTAKLAADYAQTKTGIIGNNMYARQIADEQLAFLPYTITFWQIADWLVPGGSYSINDKTPIDVLMDIAKAAGGFVESHPSRPQISIKPRWKTPAWLLADAVPDVIVPDSVIVSINGQKRVNPRYNSVHVWADHSNGKAADVYRRAENRSARAPAVVHPLYTDLPVQIAIGNAVLSDSGTHKTETVKLPVSDEYALPRANQGELWQFNEPSGHWRGVVQGVELEINRNGDGAMELWQIVTVDRYLDK